MLATLALDAGEQNRVMTEPGPPPDDGGGHHHPSAPDGDVTGSAAPVRADRSERVVLEADAADVIDLRTARTPPPLPPELEPSEAQQAPDPAARVASPDGVERRSAHTAAAPPATRPASPRAADPDDAPPRTPAVSRSLLPSLVVPLVVALLGMLAVGAASWRSATLAQQSSRHAGAAVAASVAADRVDELWAGVLGLVAGGVGQESVTPAEVRTQLGAARAERPAGVSGAAGAELRAARDAHERFVEEVADSLDRTAADPIELGNELDALAAAHGRSVDASDELVRALDASAESLASEVSAWRVAVVVLAILAVLATVLVAWWVRRRLVVLLDRPAGRVARVVHEFASGRGDARVGPNAESLDPLARSLDADLDLVGSELVTLRRRAEWGEQSRMIFEALDEAEDEETAHRVIGQALTMIDEHHHPVELLLADRGSTRLQVVAADESVPRPACPVESTGACPALRRGQVAVFDSSESINACPKLHDRPGGPRSAVCVPVTVATRPVGVLHMTGPEHEPPRGQLSDRLVTLSVQVGNRLGALRTLESTRKEASTDGLTGLPNRRMLESEVATLLERGTPFVMVLADLDKFKKLNDNFGHEVGDKALQLFAGVLRDNVRGNDVVSRLGGEEFVLVYPNMSVEISIEAIGRLRQALARAVAASRLPAFTCSFGVTHSDVGGDGDAILRIADAGLLRAKELGGDQAVFADEDLAATIFSAHPDEPEGRSGGPSER
jgi:diguanylate cyclase (GGDEF)-like protein